MANNKDWAFYRGAKPMKVRDQLAEKSGGLHQKAMRMQERAIESALWKKRTEDTQEYAQLIRDYREQRRALRK